MTDAVEKPFYSSERARLIQDQASMSNVDSKIHSPRFDCCVFLFYSLSAATFSTVSANSGHHGPRGRETQPRRAALIAATSIFFMVIIASNARFASSPPAAIASVSTRGVICQEMPHLSLHQPHSLSWPPFPTMAFQ